MRLSDPARDIVIVGGSLAGLRAGEELRRRGFKGRLTIVGAERHFPPYDRPPLSKDYLLGKRSLDETRLRTFEVLDADLKLGRRAVSLDLATNAVCMDDGAEVFFDGLIIATGTDVRQLDCTGADVDGVHYLYSADDAQRVRDLLGATRRVVVVGGGFVAAEAASVCRQLGLDVTWVSRSALPLGAALGTAVASHVMAAHERRGVRAISSSRVAAVLGDEAVSAVRLVDGRVLEADLVLVGIGSSPATSWLAGSGLALGDGVLCDAHCVPFGTRSTPIVAAGDVANWYNPLLSRQMRVAHWTNAVEQAEYAAGVLLGGRVGDGFASLPYLWSDQYDLSVHVAGTVGDEVEVLHGSVSEGAFVAALGTHGARSGVVGVNMTAAFQRERRRLAAELRAHNGQAVSPPA
jgi:3-phenylpropionate/trans-cinnamate dioxygenase ferredoxin reductase subunit